MINTKFWKDRGGMLTAIGVVLLLSLMLWVGCVEQQQDPVSPEQTEAIDDVATK